MDQSLKKWNFMPDWSPHLKWGISIFHTYGHQWMCQLWYHPRKSTIWGPSDGEGVTGYHRCLFILNLQVECIDEEKWGDFGKWLQVHVDQAQSWLDEAREKLAESTFSIKYLLHQFKEQCAYHSKPIMQQSKTQGAHAIEHILSLQSMLEAQQENLWELISEGNDVIPEDSAGEAILVKWQERVHLTKLAISQLQSNIKKRMEGLKLGDWVVARKLEQLKKDRWITMQLNLCILCEQLVQKLHAHKFKLATLDHAHSTWILDQKTKDIWEDAQADIGDFPDGVLPQWLVDVLVKKGIFIAQEVVNYDDQDGEVEEDIETEDLGFITLIDNVIGDFQ
ncbi:hypothetical protein BS47DRAFT_1368120 [Hydnum rufescens UP504]|uniref:Uncharacterized protein n=1 Tax=Hydnum rufescens UP504 TaxID=1448309 RepID=A0A9P6AGH8_9AGAM|nr:hypothetical protein BS47DRAFT_1368120 [Hydnum rufescens UP504]